jgi:hypothetical protein
VVSVSVESGQVWDPLVRLRGRVRFQLIKVELSRVGICVRPCTIPKMDHCTMAVVDEWSFSYVLAAR